MSAFSGKYTLDPGGWDGGWFGKEMFEFTNDDADPLTYANAKGQIIRPDHHFRTDMGSVPRTLQSLLPWWFDRFRFPKSYIFHDSGYKHGGHWFAVTGGWAFKSLTRRCVDDFLHEMILAEGGSTANARTIWAGVRMGGRFSWQGK